MAYKRLEPVTPENEAYECFYLSERIDKENFLKGEFDVNQKFYKNPNFLNSQLFLSKVRNYKHAPYTS